MARFDPRLAVNAISDVIQNRPLPLREFDQIYMKAGDMVMQAEFIGRRFDGKDLIFVGDGDSIGLCAAYLKHRGVTETGPQRIHVIDFDERIVKAVERFADKESMSDVITSELYNCIDALPEHLLGKFDAFYTNPPWGASNDGESVKVFMQRGIEGLKADGEGCIVIADDPEEDWARNVLRETQQFAIEHRFYVQQMQSQVHSYHLEDAPDLKSCNLFVRACLGRTPATSSAPLDGARLVNFYGREKRMRVRYVRELVRLDYGKAPDGTYTLDHLED